MVMEMVKTQLAIGAYALTAWVGLYLLISTLLRIWSRTSHLSKLHRAQVTESFISGVQGAACAVVGIVTVTACRHDVMGAKYPLTLYYSSIGTAYFLYDMWAMWMSHFPKNVVGPIAFLASYFMKNMLMIFHHIAIVFLLFPSLVYYSSMGDFFTGCFYCTELSTPFVNARVILSRLGFRHSKIYVINGLLMLTVFAMCRVAVFPLMYAAYLSQQTTAPTHIQALAFVPVRCHLSCLLVLAPQLYWLNIMIKGAIAVLKKDTTSLIDKED